jgi:trans-2,3-dihydro-3-hydroxyanthranilate isomerase
VFEDACGISDATMQALALQFNLSETTLLLPSAGAAAKVRIFQLSWLSGAIDSQYFSG